MREKECNASKNGRKCYTNILPMEANDPKSEVAQMQNNVNISQGYG